MVYSEDYAGDVEGDEVYSGDYTGDLKDNCWYYDKNQNSGFSLSKQINEGALDIFYGDKICLRRGRMVRSEFLLARPHHLYL